MERFNHDHNNYQDKITAALTEKITKPTILYVKNNSVGGTSTGRLKSVRLLQTGAVFIEE